MGEVRGKQGWGTERHPKSTGFAAVRTEKEGPKVYIANKRFFLGGKNSNKYKEMFELKRSQKLTSKGMQEYFKNKPRKDITKYSYKTRFKDGVASCRKGTKARLQTILERPTEYDKSKQKRRF